jgi:hypothetical protein
LSADFASFTDGEEFFAGRDRYEVNSLSAFGSWNEGLLWIFRVVNDNVVAGDVKESLVLNDVQILLDLAINAENEFGVK